MNKNIIAENLKIRSAENCFRNEQRKKHIRHTKTSDGVRPICKEKNCARFRNALKKKRNQFSVEHSHKIYGIDAANAHSLHSNKKSRACDCTLSTAQMGFEHHGIHSISSIAFLIFANEKVEKGRIVLAAINARLIDRLQFQINQFNRSQRYSVSMNISFEEIVRINNWDCKTL